MATQIKVGIDDEVVTLEGADAQEVINLQKQIQQEQTNSELAAQNRIDSLKASYERFITLGFSASEVEVIFTSLGLSKEEIAAIGK